MAETNSLLNCRTGNRTGGSNPPFSAKQQKTAFRGLCCFCGMLLAQTEPYEAVPLLLISS